MVELHRWRRGRGRYGPDQHEPVVGARGHVIRSVLFAGQTELTHLSEIPGQPQSRIGGSAHGKLRRGTIVLVRLHRDKARPAVVVWADLFASLSYAAVLPRKLQPQAADWVGAMTCLD